MSAISNEARDTRGADYADVSSLDVMKLCREKNVLYVDTVVEPWLGFYFDDKLVRKDGVFTLGSCGA